jgi:3-hydroxyacyl-CoA dehydrogenase/enoyl-CoA hydratase/3-hydroxybutyryl-CoA epimerase/enoyl-CoA isomerase
MPLVEVVRGSRSSDAAVATATAYASGLGKTPIVVQELPGLPGQPHPHALHPGLLRPGAQGEDYERIDRACWRPSAGRWARPTWKTWWAWTPAAT